MHLISDYNVHVSYEGLYQIDPINGDRLTYYDYFDHNSTWNIVMGSDEINNQSSNPGVLSFFEQINDKGYDFVKDKNYVGTDKGIERLSLGFNVNADYCILYNHLTLKFGLSATIIQPKNYLYDYQPPDKSTSGYQSLLRNNNGQRYFSYGLRLSLTYGF